MGAYLICRHKRNSTLISLMEALAGRFFTEGNLKEVKSSSSCNQCNTDHEIELRPLARQLTFVMTRWIDLGSGVDPYDPRLTVHARWITYGARTHLDPSDTEISPRAAFEEASANGNSFEDARSRNLTYLQDGNYRKFMKPYWFIPFTWYSWEKQQR